MLEHSYMAAFQNYQTHPPSRTVAKKRPPPPRGYSVPKVATLGVALGVLGLLLAYTLTSGRNRWAATPLTMVILPIAVVMLVVTGAGAKIAEGTARATLWTVTRAVCAADDLVCKARAQDATFWISIVSSVVYALFLLRWFIGCGAARQIVRQIARRR
jgi:hypothetical protein